MSRRAFALLLLPLAVAGWWFDDDDVVGDGVVRGSDRAAALEIVTYNVCFERPDAATVEAIAEIDADLVFLQETNSAWKELLEERLRERYPVRRYHAHDPDGGMAILSRHPVTRDEVVPSVADAFPAWCLRFDTPTGPVDVLSVHLHPPLHDDSLVAGYFLTGDDRHREIVAHLRCFDGTPDLAVGDFNEEEGDAVSHLEGLGMQQAQLSHPPAERTWRWPTPFGELSGRPDHVFVGPGWAVARVSVPLVGASDHWPVHAAVRRVAP